MIQMPENESNAAIAAFTKSMISYKRASDRVAAADAEDIDDAQMDLLTAKRKLEQQIDEIAKQQAHRLDAALLLQVQDVMGDSSLVHRVMQEFHEHLMEHVRVTAGFHEQKSEHPERDDVLLRQSLADFDLHTILHKSFRKLGLVTVAQLVNCTASELLDCKGFGTHYLEQTRAFLSTLNLRLRGD